MFFGKSLAASARVRIALICFTMACLLARSVAVIAIYSIAVQTLLLGYLHASHLGFDPVAVICTSGDGSNNHDRPFLPHGGSCDPCALACNGTCAGIVPPDAKFSIAPPYRLVGTPTAWVEAVSLPARHRPHASRAPPISA
jgi:hypothetical protein